MAENIRASVVILLDRKTADGKYVGLLPGRGSGKVCVIEGAVTVPEQAVGTTSKGDKAATFRGFVTTTPVKQLTAAGVVEIQHVSLLEGEWSRPGSGKPAAAESAALPF